LFPKKIELFSYEITSYFCVMFTSLSAKNNDFFEQVYAVVRLIPEGRVTTYGAIAAYLGSKNHQEWLVGL